jgi:hypothetical protein
VKIGDKVIVSHLLRKTRSDEGRNQRIVWVEIEIPPVECVYLGYVTVYDGTLFDTYDAQRRFERSASHRAHVVQPLSAGNLYRKPFRVKQMSK